VTRLVEQAAGGARGNPPTRSTLLPHPPVTARSWLALLPRTRLPLRPGPSQPVVREELAGHCPSAPAANLSARIGEGALVGARADLRRRTALLGSFISRNPRLPHIGMPDTSKEQTSVIRDYLQVLSRRRWVVLLVLVAVPIAAVLLSLRQEPRYEAVAEVLMTDDDSAATVLGSSSGNRDPVRAMETQAELARGKQVAQAAVERSGLRGLTGEDLLADSEVTANQTSDLLQFSATAGDPRSAERLATAYAYEFASFRRELTASALRTARDRLEQQLRELPEEATTATARGELAYQIQQLRAAEALQTSSSLIPRAASGASQVQPNAMRSGLMGLALALVLGVGLAFLLEALDTRVRSEDEIEQILGAPMLGRLPPPDGRRGRPADLSVLCAPDGARADAVRVVKKNLEFAALNSLSPKVVMVASALPGEGKSTTMAELGLAFGRAGWRVALIDLDLRRPTLSALLGVPDGPGLSEVALGHLTLDEALVPVPLEAELEPASNGDGPHGSVELLPAGATPPRPGEFVESEAIAWLFRDTWNSVDLVLVDSSPLLAVGDALSVSELVDAVLLVTRFDKARRPTLTELKRTLDSTSKPVLGTILTGVPGGDRFGRSDPFYGYTPARSPARPARFVA
jgi:polysaccharide biosynthesis transport protein